MDFSVLYSVLVPMVVVAACLIVIKLLFLLTNKKKEKPVFKLETNLLTVAEMKFFEFLYVNLNTNDFHIATKVRLADVFNCVSKGKIFYNGFNKIKAKHFDFVIVSKKDSKILMAIELDDRSHSKPKAMFNDKFKNDVCSDTGLKLIRVPVSAKYDEKTLELFNI